MAKDPGQDWPLGQFLSTRRKSKGLSVRTAARKAGISEGRWRQVENGYQTITAGQRIPVMPKPETLFKMCRALEADAEQGMRLVGYNLADYPWLLEEAQTAEASDKAADLAWFTALPRADREEPLGRLQRLHVELEVEAARHAV